MYTIFVLFWFVNSFIYCKSWVVNDINESAFYTKKLLDDVENNEISQEALALMRFNMLFPGTKWCGAGNSAENYDDLGSSSDTDKCCREHDLCPDIILAGETRHNLTNEAYYTRLSCYCDEKFHRCLHSVDSATSSTVGMVYFNLINTQCFRNDHAIMECKKYGGWLRKKCLEYVLDPLSELKFQWFDVPSF